MAESANRIGLNTAPPAAPEYAVLDSADRPAVAPAAPIATPGLASSTVEFGFTAALPLYGALAASSCFLAASCSFLAFSISAARALSALRFSHQSHRWIT